jgi:hypothetical protein
LDLRVKGDHLSAAINAVSSILQARRQKGATPNNDSVWNPRIWQRCFDLYISRSENGKSKVLKSLLAILLSLLSDCDGTAKDGILVDTTSKLRIVLSGQMGQGGVKASLLALRVLLTKKVISLWQALDVFSVPSVNGNAENLRRVEDAVQQLLQWSRFHDLAPTAGQTFSTLWQLILQERNLQSSDVLWITPLTSVLKDNPHSIPVFQTNLFPSLFAADTKDYCRFLFSLGLEKQFGTVGPPRSLGPDTGEDEVETTILFAALQAGKEHGLVLEYGKLEHLPTSTGFSPTLDKPGFQVTNGIIQLGFASLRKALFVGPSRTRFLVLRVILTSQSSTKPLQREALRILRQCIPIFCADIDPGVRGDFLTLIKSLLARIQATTFSMSNKMNRVGKDFVNPRNHTLSETSDLEVLLEAHRGFISWLHNYCISQLRPDSSYQIHFCALKILLLVINSNIDSNVSQRSGHNAWTTGPRWIQLLDVFTPTLTRALQDLVQDPFEDIRNLSSELLYLSAVSKPEVVADLQKYHHYAYQRMLSSGRQDDTDGVARLDAVLFQCSHSPATFLNEIVRNIEGFLDDLSHSMETAYASKMVEFPLHGPLTSLRYVFDRPGQYELLLRPSGASIGEWTNLHGRIVTIVLGVWDHVKNVLCVDAPEGFTTEEMKDADVDTKDLFSYAWRALKAAALLIGTLARRCPLAKITDKGFLSEGDLETLANLCFTSLKELRHRGAFSAVSVAFSACCNRLHQGSKDDFLKQLLDRTFETITDQASVLTRRSAGIPMLMTGILCSDPGGPIFVDAMHRLQATAMLSIQDEASLPQVHALNCLRSVFTHNVLGPCSDLYIPQAFSLAGSCLTSKLWPIRNSGLMLFRSLVDRVLGTTEEDSQGAGTSSKRTTKFSYTNYPDLLPMVLRLLEPSDEQLLAPEASIESVFPALKMVQRAPPSQYQERVRRSVFRLCGSSQWHVRDMAARAYASVIPDPQALQTIRDLLEQVPPTQNGLHGLLLTLKYLIQDKFPPGTQASHESRQELATLIALRKTLLIGNTHSPFTKDAYLKLENILLRHAILSYHAKGQLGTSTDGNATHFDLQESNTILAWLAHELNTAEEQISSDDAHSIEDVLIRSARTNATELSHAFNEASDLIATVAVPPSSCQKLAHAVAKVLPCDDDILTESAQRLLVKIGEQSNFKTSAADVSQLEESFLRTDIPPSLLETTIQLWSISICFAELRTDPEFASERILRFQYALNILQDKSRSFPIRIAAAKALKTFCGSIQQSAYLSELSASDVVQLRSLLLVYDCLNDDDEEVRDLGAETAAIILRSPRIVVPVIACRRIAKLILESFSDNAKLANEAMRRVINESDLGQIKSAQAQESVLFRVEKENLYIDEAGEAALWSGILKNLSSKAVSGTTAKRLSTWTTKSLYGISESLRDSDEGCSWQWSRPDSFIFIMRVLCATSVVLAWEANPDIALPSDLRILESLLDFIALARDCGISPLLAIKAEQVAKEGIIAALRRRAKLLRRYD